MSRGDFERAAAAYFSAPEPDPLPPDSTLALGNWLAEHGHTDAALVLYRRFIRDHGDHPAAADAQLGAGLMEMRRGQLATAYQHLRAVLDLDPSLRTRTLAIDAIDAIAARQKYPMRRYATPIN